MNLKRIVAALSAAAVAAASMTAAASAEAADIIAAGEELVLTPEDTKGLKKITYPETDVVFVKEATYSGIVSGESGGEWLIGGDNGDTGISIETLQSYDYLEVDYTYTLNADENKAIEGVMVGLAFKVKIKDRLDDFGGEIFYDYTPATWVPYGPDGTSGRGTSVNSLEAIYSTQVQTEGTISISTEYLLSKFEPDSNYLMGIGLGTDNKTYISEEDLAEKWTYTIKCDAIRLTNTKSANAAPNYLTDDISGAEAEAPAETEAVETEPEETEAPAETEAPEAAPEATSAAVSTAPTAGASSSLMIIGIVAAAVAVIVIVVIIIVSKKNR